VTGQNGVDIFHLDDKRVKTMYYAGHFAPAKVTLPKDILPKDILPNGHFADGRFAERTFCRTGILPNGYFTERTVCRTDTLSKIEIIF
jgi:hypothetical protein